MTRPPREDRREPGERATRLAHLLVVLLASLAVNIPRLGSTGLSASEGHRAIPGWEMLDSGRWLEPTLFERPYLTKPPGLSWCVALASLALGENEWAARAPSALAGTLSALACCAFGARWFGARWGIWAGLAQVLTPQNWWFTRAGEIESLHTASAQVASLALLDLLVARGRWRSGIVALAAGACMWLSKGPAGATTIAGALGVGILFSGRRSPGRVLGSLALAALPALAFWLVAGEAAARAGANGGLTQSPADFLWPRTDLAGLAGALALGPTAIALALPTSLSLLARGLFSPPAPDEDDAEARARHLARSAAWTCLSSLAILTLLGVTNPRYALPSVSTLPVLVAFAARQAARAPGVWRVIVVRRRWLAAALALGWAFFIGVHEPALRATSGRGPGAALAEHLPDGAEVWSDHLIAARPETLHAAREACARAGRRVRVRWVADLARDSRLPAIGGFVVLRRDRTTDEERPLRESGAWERLERVAHGRVHEFEFTLFRVAR